MHFPTARPATRVRVEWVLLAICVLLRTAFCAYRAVTQSITHDEAFTYLNYVRGPWPDLRASFDANNHLLYTVLARLAVALFGVSEFALRLPSVISGAVFSVGVVVALAPVRAAPVRWLTMLAILLHPLLLDFSVAARGYSLSLALLVWAAIALWLGRYAAAGVTLGLATAANLTALFPALAMMVSITLILRRVTSAMFTFVVVFAGFAFVALRAATPAHFYVGTRSLEECFYNLILLSIRTSFEHPGAFGTEEAARWLQWVALPIAGLSMYVSMLRVKDRRMWLPLVVLSTSVLGLIAAHFVFGVLYPVDRTGLWLIVALLFAWGYAASREWQAVHCAVALALILQFATQIQSRSFIVWAYDHDTKQVAEQIRGLTMERMPGSVWISASPARQPALEFYRLVLPMEAARPIERSEHPALCDADFYVLTFPEVTLPEVRRLRVLSEDKARGSLFATN